MNMAKEILPDVEHDIEDVREVVELANIKQILDNVMTIDDETELGNFLEEHAFEMNLQHHKPIFSKYLHMIFLTALLYKEVYNEEEE